MDALVEIIERLSYFASKNPDVAELDINPSWSPPRVPGRRREDHLGINFCLGDCYLLPAV